VEGKLGWGDSKNKGHRMKGRVVKSTFVWGLRALPIIKHETKVVMNLNTGSSQGYRRGKFSTLTP
jgi:hypothetical protein